MKFGFQKKTFENPIKQSSQDIDDGDLMTPLSNLTFPSGVKGCINHSFGMKQRQGSGLGAPFRAPQYAKAPSVLPQNWLSLTIVQLKVPLEGGLTQVPLTDNPSSLNVPVKICVE